MQKRLEKRARNACREKDAPFFRAPPKAFSRTPPGVRKTAERKRADADADLAVALEKRLDDLAEIRVVFDQALDLLDGVHDGRVVLVVEEPADLRVREAGQFSAEIHRHLARKGDRLGVGP